MPIYTVDQAATSFANWKLEGQKLAAGVRETYKKRYVWDAKVHIFNASTVAAIVTLALAIFRSSPLMLIFSCLFYAIRLTFMDNINLTAPDGSPDLLAPRGIESIKNYLEIPGSWEPIQHQFLKLRLWMRPAPEASSAQLAAVHEAAERRENEAIRNSVSLRVISQVRPPEVVAEDRVGEDWVSAEELHASRVDR